MQINTLNKEKQLHISEICQFAECMWLFDSGHMTTLSETSYLN